MNDASGWRRDAGDAIRGTGGVVGANPIVLWWWGAFCLACLVWAPWALAVAVEVTAA